MILFLLVYLLSCHFCSCMFAYISKVQNNYHEAWIGRLGFQDSTTSDLYIISLYWTLTTITTVGYGDIAAGTTPEKIFNLFVMSIGIIMYSFAIGSLSSIVASYEAKDEEMNKKLDVLESIRKEFNINKETINKARKVIKFEMTQNHKDRANLIEILPNKLRYELSKAMYHHNIMKLHFFRKKPTDFIAYVSTFFKTVKYTQEYLLYKVGDIVEESK